MSEYLDNLPGDANIGQVFYDLHSKAREVVEGLNLLRDAEYGPGSDQKPVPGTELEVDWAWIRGQSDASAYTSTTIRANMGWDSHSLIRVGFFSEDGRPRREPFQIEGYRNDEIGADYSMRQRSPEMPQSEYIAFALAYRGLPRPRKHPEEPLGEVERPPYAPIAELQGANLRAFEAVTQGILDNLTMVELIREGTPARDALEMMDRVPVES